MKITQRRGIAAFTLIEMMAVVTIIVILASLGVGVMNFVQERQAKEKAKVQIALLSRALEEYKLDMGTYPATPNVASVSAPAGTATSATYLWLPLFKDGYDFSLLTTDAQKNSWTKATKIYCADLNPISSKQGWVTNVTSLTTTSTSTVVDPWGNQYCYRTAFGIPVTDSSGKVTVPTNNATMNPDFDLWSMGKDGKTNADLKHKDSLDDIKNF